MKRIIKIFIIFIAIATFLITVTGCGNDATTASYNISKEADMFKVKRRVVFINLRTGDYLFSITGNCSIQNNSHNELEVICKVGEDKYQKHFLYLSTETTYTIEQLEYSEVSKYDYEIVFRPEAIVPIKIETEVG